MAHLINLSHEQIDSEYDLAGYDCIDADGRKVGDVDGVIVDAETMRPHYVVVDAGGWFTTRRFVVPAGDIAEIDDDEHEVCFRRLTKELLESGSYPRYDETWWERNDHAGFEAYERGVARAYEPERPVEQPVDYTQPLYRGTGEETRTLQLLEEHLLTGKERYQAGTVRLGKRIIERTETVNVPIQEERVVIERHPVAGESRPGSISGEEVVVEVPVMKERVLLDREAVVVEEVSAHKEVAENVAEIEAIVRKEELVVDGDAEVDEVGTGTSPHGATVYEEQRTARTERP